MINDKKARLLTVLMFALDEMDKNVGKNHDKLESTINDLSSVLDEIAYMLKVDNNDVLYGLLHKFSGVDAFHPDPTEKMLVSESYKMLDTVVKACAELAKDLKIEIEKAEK